MTTYKQLKRKFEKDVLELKKNCKHKQLSNWKNEWWAIGHSTGFEVRSCKKCSDIIKRRTPCNKCSKITEKFINGDGRRRAWGEQLCPECDKIENNRRKLLICEKCKFEYYLETKKKGTIMHNCMGCEKNTKHNIVENK